MTVLVISSPQDLSADSVVRKLRDRGVPFVRFDLGDFPAAVSLHAATGDGWGGWLATSHHRVDLADVTAVYYRRPSLFRLSPTMSEAERDWATWEAREGFGGVLMALPCRWVNHPHRNAVAGNKPIQLAAAIRAGLAIPETIVTNDPHEARLFATSPTVYKAMGGSPEVAGFAIYTDAVSGSIVGVAATAHMFQRQVAKTHDIRLTIAGPAMLAARITSPLLDWREDYDVAKFETTEVPKDVSAGIARLMTDLDLRYAAIDFVVDPDGQWLLVDVNPNGQWGFVENYTGLPIADAIAADLQGDT